MNLQKNKNKNQKINQKKIWISFLGFLIISFYLSLLPLSLSYGQSVETQAKATGIPIKSDGDSDTTTDDGIASPEPDVETPTEATGIPIKSDGGSDTTTDDGIVSPEPEEVISKITSDVNLFTSDIQSQTLTNPSYFVANGKVNTVSLAQMQITIPALTQGVKRNYEIKNLDLDASTMQIETKIFIDEDNKKDESIILNINWNSISPENIISLKEIDNITVSKHTTEKVYYKHYPQLSNLEISGIPSGTTNRILNSTPVDESGKSEIKIEFTKTNLPKFEKTFEVTNLESQSKEENDLLLDSKLFKLSEGITTIDENKYKDKIIPYGFNLPDSVTSIGKFAFRNAALPPEFTLSNNTNLITIKIGAFYEAKFLPAGFNFPDSLTNIEESAFDITILPADFTLNNTQVTIISKNTFHNSIFLKNFTLAGSKIKSIGWYAFRKSFLPAGFNLNTNIMNIEFLSFQDAILPVNFTIPDSVTIIGIQAFKNAKIPNKAKWFDKTNTQNDIIAAGSYVALEPRS